VGNPEAEESEELGLLGRIILKWILTKSLRMA
jgi:hypothetical protein